ncbi:hypothetical protein HRbin19_00272 [bacterium HR19]|nr:hypothetical protein HRbin19_00272 [bacterium HR19]
MNKEGLGAFLFWRSVFSPLLISLLAITISLGSGCERKKQETGVLPPSSENKEYQGEGVAVRYELPHQTALKNISEGGNTSDLITARILTGRYRAELITGRIITGRSPIFVRVSTEQNQDSAEYWGELKFEEKEGKIFAYFKLPFSEGEW